MFIKLNKGERNYSTTKREGLGMIYLINKFRYYLLGNKVTFHVDHLALMYLVIKAKLTGKLQGGCCSCRSSSLQ